MTLVDSPVTARTATAVSVEGLTISYGADPVVTDVDFELRNGETLAVVGQSGSGKTTIARAAIGMLAGEGRITSGSVRIAGTDVTRYTQSSWRRLRGSTIGFVPQDPLGSLDPLKKVGHQIAETLLLHRIVQRRRVVDETVALLDRVGIRNPAERAGAYPHQLSGGQLQRVLIAIAIAARPSILVADEPTSALDVTVQARILDLLDDLRRDLGLGVLFITHDLALARDHADDVLVLNHGIVREQGRAAEVLASPSDDYTRRLIADAPALSLDKYASRPAARVETALEVRDLVKTFAVNGSRTERSTALDGVSFTVARGTTHAVVGESGSGKTTAARIVSGLERQDSGEVLVHGSPLDTSRRARRGNARRLQLVQQNALAAMDPRYSVENIVAEPLSIAGVRSRAERRDRVHDVLDKVALPRDILERRPFDLSGGQRQRVVLARSLVLAPDILVLDEPTSALDVSVQARIVDLLVELQRDLSLTYVFISHDLSLVRQVSDTVTVLEHGRNVESGNTADLFRDPREEYTQRLIESIPGRAHVRA
ncbi:dipeptide ABC transporter ATP-binding protein [Rhodococcoides fascians]|uniref:dipeptide ABC transporter ATP-binding protein n=1 Tax=Rhodococcoides fascians TaxID=1828 RepID=UPI0005664A37|nr:MULTISPECIES: ABC transporter ATP-binding protein [Rhodococcus]OZC77536.1 ABC transporter ATP-binding protein [Rhodococcus sp. 06-418-1B]OZC77651.1 ABC transporter ATP-binding protein [Rhodococcus sp. 06-418-1B]